MAGAIIILEGCDQMTFGEALKKARTELGLSQVELGQAIHVSFSTINRYENGWHKPTPIIMDALNKLFETNKIVFEYADGSSEDDASEKRKG